MSRPAFQREAGLHQVDDLIRLFDQLFSGPENTRLVRGEQEPVYLPADKSSHFHQVVFAHGFFSSALHEIAHWCLAGEQRRLQVDYGYWYAPDGRSETQQNEFEQVEVKPQALEWIFSKACKKSFRISVDNLNGAETDSGPFKSAVCQQAQYFCQHGLPPRAALLVNRLVDYYQTDLPTSGCFQLGELG